LPSRVARRTRLSHVSFHLKSAVFAVFCLVLLVVFFWVNAARAQAENFTVATTTRITASVNPVAPDGAVTFTAHVEAGRNGVPGGSIDFIDESTMICLGRADVASPSITVSNLAPGTHPIRAHYLGTSAFLPVVTTPRLEISTSRNPSAPGEPLTLNASVSAQSRKPTGTVTFRDGDRIIAAKIKLDHDGRAAFITSALSGGAHALSAEYEGDVVFAKAVATVRQDVGDGPAESFRIGRIRQD
jgi:hypothetical protein